MQANILNLTEGRCWNGRNAENDAGHNTSSHWGCKSRSQGHHKGSIPSTGRNAVDSGPKAARPQLRQPTFDWSAQNKFDKIKGFVKEVRNIFMTKIIISEMQKKYP